MDTVSEQMRDLLEREVELHRDLLALARARHCLLRQGRIAEVPQLVHMEARGISVLRDLEATRTRLAREFRNHVGLADDLAVSRRRITALVRQLGAVERANRSLWNRYAARLHAPTGAGIWSMPALIASRQSPVGSQHAHGSNSLSGEFRLPSGQAITRMDYRRD